MSRVEAAGLRFCPADGFASHYTKDSLHPCVPMHREIKPKTLSSILKQANITAEQLLENL
jgi:hypothetical protein